MKGALLELAARGEEDIVLIGNPQFSYFKITDVQKSFNSQ